jgi:hypothetical protein
MAQNGEFQNPKGRVLESKFSTEARQKRFSTVSVKRGLGMMSASLPLSLSIATEQQTSHEVSSGP